MKSIKLAALAVVGTAVITGCGVEPGEVQGDESYKEIPSPSSAAPRNEELPPALDGRAAARAGLKEMTTSVNAQALASSWYSGSVAPGATQHWYWNNSSLTGAYKVGLSPTGASTTSPCQFEVTRSWDAQQYGGEHEFHFTIKNTGSITCGTNILLGWQDRSSTWATGGIDVGASKTWVWNNANPLTAAHFVGVSPSGATSSNPCQLEVTRSWYGQQPTGEREFYFTVTNVGAIACQGDIQLVTNTNANSSWATGSMSPGTSKGWVWNNANPLDRVYTTGLSPAGATGTSTCQLEVTKTTYQQVINADGTTERKYYMTVQNAGGLTCSGTVLLNYL